MGLSAGFLEELGKVEDGRVQGYLRIIERLNLEIHEKSSEYAVKRAALISFYSALLLVSEIGDQWRVTEEKLTDYKLFSSEFGNKLATTFMSLKEIVLNHSTSG